MPATVPFRGRIAERLWQARDVDLPQPDPHTPHLADVVPSVLAAMGVAGFDGPLDLAGEIRGACVLLVDGLGSELLDAHADDAPVMAALRGHDAAGRISVDHRGRAGRSRHRMPVRRARTGRSVIPAARRRGDQLPAVAPPSLGRRSSRDRAARAGATAWRRPSNGRPRRASR